MIIYIVIFTVLGGLPVVFYLATLGSHVTWIVVLYFNRRFFQQETPSISFRNIQSSQEGS